MGNEGEGKMKRAVCLVSGGMDSCVAAAIASQNYPELFFLHLNYKQRTEKRERKAFRDIAKYYKAKTLEVEVSYFKQIGGSALTDERIPVPKEVEENEEVSQIPITYVPFRNAHILSMGVSWAEVVGAEALYIGVVEEDASGYPDCRESFIKAFQKAVNEGTKPETKIKIFTPLIHLSKAEIVTLGVKLHAPLHLTWSCYVSNGPKACGKCKSCKLRLKGFREAGIKDMIEYENL